jgi:hypothetical protein
MYSNYSMPAPNGVDFRSGYRDLYIYHPGTGTLIALSDVVYLVDAAAISEELLDEMSEGVQVAPQEHLGYMLDNYNMNNLFFGEE